MVPLPSPSSSACFSGYNTNQNASSPVVCAAMALRDVLSCPTSDIVQADI
jgi:hypothetical protein